LVYIGLQNHLLELTGRLAGEYVRLVGVNFKYIKMAEFYDQNSVAVRAVVRAKI
jgi:hypothetical protein